MRQRFNSVEDFFFFSFGLKKGHTALKGLLFESGDILQLKRSFSASCPHFFHCSMQGIKQVPLRINRSASRESLTRGRKPAKRWQSHFQ
jgi:hypothetical protein